VTSHPKQADLGPIQLCLWVLPYAFRRWKQLLIVLITMLLGVGLSVLQPWPMAFLIDHVLKSKPMPEAMARLVEWLPGSPT